jgi:glycerol-3-phosphate O-acyltransferase
VRDASSTLQPQSHTDYLVEPLVLDDNGVRPPIIAAGINLFGGPLGLIHKHVTARFRFAGTRRTRRI